MKKKSILLLIMMSLILMPVNNIVLADSLSSLESQFQVQSKNTVIVGLSNSGQTMDYICDNVGADIKIQDAINTTNSKGGGVVKVLPGTYYIKKEIKMKSNVVLLMDKGAILKLPNQVIQPLKSPFTANDNKINVQDGSQYVVGMSIGLVADATPGYKDGEYSEIIAINGDELTISPAINKSYTNGAVISHYGLIGVHNKAENVSIIGGELDLGVDSGRQKIHITNADSMFNGISSSDGVGNLLIKDVYVHGAYFRGIHLWGSQKNAIIYNCRAENNYSGGITLDTVYNSVVNNDSHVSIVNTVSKNNGGHGLYSSGVTNLNVYGGEYSNNLFSGIEACNNRGMLSYTHDNISISNAIIKDNNKSGIELNQTSRAVITNNTIKDNAQIGINIKEYSKWVAIENNNISGSNTGILENNYADNTMLFENNINGCKTNVSLSGKYSIDYNKTIANTELLIGNKINSSHFTPSQFMFEGKTLTNMLGNYGNVETHATDYTNYGVYGNISIWTSNLVENVDGYNVIDGMFSDFEWGKSPGQVRSNYVKVPSVSGHKYLITMKVKNKFSITEVDSNSGAEIKKEESNTSNWDSLSYVADGTGKDLYFLLRSDYVTHNAGYCRDIQVIDLTDSGEENLNISDLNNIYGNLYINESKSVESFKVNISSVNENQKDLLNGSGMLDNKESVYIGYGQYGALYFWGAFEKPLEKTVDGHKVIDGMYSDYEWKVITPNLNNPRANFVRIPSISGRNYVLTAKVKGNTTIEQIDPDTGVIVDATHSNSNDWSNITFKANGTGKDLVFLLKSAYIERDKGYFRDVQAFDLNSRNDQNLSSSDIQNKYSNDSNLIADNISKELNVNETLRSIGNVKDTLSADGILTRKINHITLNGNDISSMTDLNNVSVLKINATSMPGIATNLNNNTINIYGLSEVKKVDADSTSNSGGYFVDIDGSVGLIVDKNKYSDIQSAKNDISNLDVDYVLSSSIQQNITGKFMAMIGQNTTVDITTSSVKPIINYTLPENLKDITSLNNTISNGLTNDDKKELYIDGSIPKTIDISGENDIKLKAGQTYETTYNAITKDQNNNVISSDITWHVFGNTKGVTIDETGKITVIESAATSGAFVIEAMSSVDNSIVGMRVVNLITPLLANSIPPILQLTVSTTDWTNGKVTVNAMSIDNPLSNSTVSKMYLPDGKVINTKESNYVVNQNGTYTFRVEDTSGNKVSQSIQVNNIDIIKPTLVLTKKDITDAVKISAVSTDTGSGVKQIKLPDNTIVKGANATYQVTKTGSYTFEVTDLVGNITSQSIVVDTISSNPIPTNPTKPTTSTTSSSNDKDVNTKENVHPTTPIETQPNSNNNTIVTQNKENDVKTTLSNDTDNYKSENNTSKNVITPYKEINPEIETAQVEKKNIKMYTIIGFAVTGILLIAVIIFLIIKIIKRAKAKQLTKKTENKQE